MMSLIIEEAAAVVAIDNVQDFVRNQDDIMDCTQFTIDWSEKLDDKLKVDCPWRTIAQSLHYEIENILEVMNISLHNDVTFFQSIKTMLENAETSHTK